MIKLHAVGFEHAKYLNRRVDRLGLKQRVGAQAAQTRQRLRGRHPRYDAFETRQLGEHFIPLDARLKFRRVERALTGETHGFEQRGKMAAPGRWRIHPRRQLLRNFIECLEALTQQCTMRHQCGDAGERHARRQASAQLGVEPRTPGALALRTADKRRTQQPA